MSLEEKIKLATGYLGGKQEENGGKNLSSISLKTSFILGGDKIGPAKREKAAALGIEIIDETQFLKMINKL